MFLQKYSWERFCKDIVKIRDATRSRNFTAVYGIPRGGLVPAVCLSHLLDLPLILREEDIGPETLVCDDILSSGAQFNALTARLGFKPFLAVLFFVLSCEAVPDLYVNILEENRTVCIVFPWETEASALESLRRYCQEA